MGFFGDIAAVQVSSMLFYAAYGVSISIILKNVGAIARTLINTIAICFTALLDVAFFGESINVLEGTTFAIIFILLRITDQIVLLKNRYKPRKCL